MEGIIRTGVSFFCHDGQGKYLIFLRSQNCRDEQGRWEQGSGGLKFGEKIEDVVRREVQEEYSAQPIEVEPMGFRDVFRKQNGKLTHWIMFDFRVLVNPDEVKNNEPHKCDGLKWLTIEETKNFGEPLHSQFPAFFYKYGERFI